MPRPVSAVFRTAVNREETGEVFLALLRLYHASIIGGPMRFVNDTTTLPVAGSDAAEYLGCPFEIAFPDDRDDQLPEVSLRIDNVDRQITQTVRTITTPVDAELEMVVASQPTIVEVPAQRFTMRVVTGDIYTVTGTLRFEDVLNARFPDLTFDGRWVALR
jgi:hypothetical protein